MSVDMPEPENNWSRHDNPQKKAENDFSNALAEIVFAAERGDSEMVRAHADVLRGMYRLAVERSAA